ncbi:MAG: LCP family protein [Chroococcales cyanobacterium]
MPARKVQQQRPRADQYGKPIRKRRIKKKSYRGRWLLIWLALTGVATLSATAGALLAVSISSTPLQQAELSAEESAIFTEGEAISRKSLRLPELTRPVNVLVLGTKVLTSDVNDPTLPDLGYHALVNSFDGLSDTMLLVRFDPQTEKVLVISIPRDTRAYVEGYGVTKINNANAYGGPALAAKAVSNLLGDVPIDRYVRVNVQGVEKFIDALGGVTVYVPKDMKYRDDSQHLYIDLKEGEQHLNGNKALQFLRFRYDKYGDIGRVQRQQMMMRALVQQALNPSIVVRVPKIISVIQSHLDTNLSVEEIVALTGFATQSDRSNVQMVMLPGDFNGDGREEVSYWLPSRTGIRQILAQHFDQGYETVNARDSSYLRVAIQDSTDNPQAVRLMVSRLQELGYRNIYIDDEWPEPLRVTRVIAQRGDSTNAKTVQGTLGFGEVWVESTGALNSDVTIQLGEDWLQREQLFEGSFR